MEVWGAQGGSSFSATGGKGGYSYGNISINANTQLYICVGQCTGDVGSTYDSSGISAYNGGGTGSSSGGGATHIAKTTNRGVLSKYANNKSEVLIVAGGGGGGADSGWGTGIGGTGGGTSGGNGTEYSSLTQRATGGSQTGPGKNGSYSGYPATTTVNTPGFGQGGGCNYNGNHGGGGGGGYYGGGGYPWAGSGAGGSGYIGGVSSGSMQNGVQSGHGKAVITWHPMI